MAEQKESVVYEFQGDLSSLKSTTNGALELLDKFQKKMDSANSEGIVRASQRAQSSFNSSVKRITQSVTALQGKLTSVGDVKTPRGTEVFNTMRTAVTTLGTKLTTFTSSSSVTTKGLNELRTSLNNLNTGLKSAGPAVDQLVAKEAKFQQTLETVRNTSNRLAETMRSKLNSIGERFAPLVSKMQAFKDRATEAGSRVSQIFSTVASAFRRTSDGTEGASNSQKKLGRELEETKEKFNNQATSQKKLTNGYKSMQAVAQACSKAISTGAEQIGKALRSVKDVTQGVIESFFTLAGVQLGDVLSAGAKSAIDYVENLNLFKVAMGSSLQVGEQFVAKMSEVYGMDPSNLYRYAGYFYQLTSAIGMCNEASSTLSLSMTKASNDIASLFNKDVQTVVEDLASGMQGMSRSVRKYGMDIRVTTLQQTAYEYGLTEEVETMSEANRQALRYITMLKQVQKALKQTTTDTEGVSSEMGDFARNIETPANQLRIFKEQISQLGRAIGTFIVAPLSNALPYINGFVMSLRVALNFLSAFMGLSVKSGESLDNLDENTEDASDGIDSIGDSATKAAKDLKKLTTPMDELNVLSEESSSGISSEDYLDPSLLEAIQNMSLDLENIQMKANQVRDSLLATFGFTVNAEGKVEWSSDIFKESLIKMFPKWEDTLNSAFENWNAGGIGQVIGVFISSALEKFIDYVSWGNISTRVTKVVETILQVLNNVISTVDGERLGAAFGTFLNTVLQTLLTLIGTFDWEALGKWVADAVNGTLNTIDWAEVGNSLAGLSNALFTTLLAMVSTIDWETVATSLTTAIKELFASLDYDSMMQTLIHLLIGATELLVELVPTLLEAGASLLDGIAQGFEEHFPTFIEKLPGLVQRLADGIEEQLPKLLQAVANIIASLVMSIIEALPTIIATIPVIIEGLINALLEAIPNIMDTGTELITSLFDNFDEIMVPLLYAIGNIIGRLIGGILALTPDIIRCGVDLLVALVGGMPEIIVTLVAALPALITGLIDGLLSHIPEIVEAGIKLVGSLLLNAPQIVFEIVKAVPDIIKGIVTAFTSAVNLKKMADVGLNLIKGLWQGISDSWTWLKNKASDFADKFTSSIKGFFGIHSPSKETYWMGEMLTQGLANAIEDTSKVVVKATGVMCKQIDGTLGGITSSVGKATDSLGLLNADVTTQIGTSITPVVNPTRAIINGVTTGDTSVASNDSELLQKLVDVLDKNNPDSPDSGSGSVEVKVYIGDDEYDAYTYKASERGKKIVGKQPIKIGG